MKRDRGRKTSSRLVVPPGQQPAGEQVDERGGQNDDRHCRREQHATQGSAFMRRLTQQQQPQADTTPAFGPCLRYLVLRLLLHSPQSIRAGAPARGAGYARTAARGRLAPGARVGSRGRPSPTRTILQGGFKL
jgi:hypothetical protein